MHAPRTPDWYYRTDLEDGGFVVLYLLCTLWKINLNAGHYWGKSDSVAIDGWLQL